MRGSGNTDGGIPEFGLGFVLAAVALYFFLDSVRVSTDGAGMLSRMLGGGGAGGGWRTTSMGIVFVPFLAGTIALFANARWTWAWVLMWTGLAIIVVEILSRIRFLMTMKASHLLLMMVAFAAVAGLMIRSYLPDRRE